MCLNEDRSRDACRLGPARGRVDGGGPVEGLPTSTASAAATIGAYRPFPLTVSSAEHPALATSGQHNQADVSRVQTQRAAVQYQGRQHADADRLREAELRGTSEGDRVADKADRCLSLESEQPASELSQLGRVEP